MFINSIKMIEPATASIAVYLLTKTSKVKPYVLRRQPFHYKKKLCKWIVKNKHLIIETGFDEFSDYLFEISNNIHIPSPTIALIIYWVMIIILIFV